MPGACARQQGLMRHGLTMPLYLALLTSHGLMMTMQPALTIDRLACMMQLVSKWRAISSAARSEGVHNHYQAIRQKASRRVAHQPEAIAKPVRPASSENIIRSQDLVSRLYDNGYIKPKLIRIRLLHYWICRLLGKPFNVCLPAVHSDLVSLLCSQP